LRRRPDSASALPGERLLTMRSKSHPSLKRHVEAFRDVGAEAGRMDDAAAHFLVVVVAWPTPRNRRDQKNEWCWAARFGGIERIIGIGLEEAGLFRAAAVGLTLMISCCPASAPG